MATFTVPAIYASNVHKKLREKMGVDPAKAPLERCT